MELALQPVQVAVAGGSEGRLVVAPHGVVAVLVRLPGDHGEEAGCWFLEAGFGSLDVPVHPVFPDLDAAQRWCVQRLARAPAAGGRPG